MILVYYQINIYSVLCDQIVTHLKLCLAAAIHNFKWVTIVAFNADLSFIFLIWMLFFYIKPENGHKHDCSIIRVN